MERKILDSVDVCNSFLRANASFANGKNSRIHTLYATSANSRWQYENIWGMYLAKPQCAWMALWMAITARARVRKRQIGYHRPETGSGDCIGHIALYSPHNMDRDDVIVQEDAYLYLFPPVYLSALPKLDVSGEPKSTKAEVLGRNGFVHGEVTRRGKTYHALVHTPKLPHVVDIDTWQVAVVGVEEIAPAIEVRLTRALIRQLALRIQWSSIEIGEEYIV